MMSKSTQSPEMVSSQIPEWRRAAAVPDVARSPQIFARRPKLKEPAKYEGGFKEEEILHGIHEKNLSPRRNGPTPDISLDSLGSDIWFLISSYLPKSALISICQTSLRLYSTIIPILYHTIDLSVHARPDGIVVPFRVCRKTWESQYMFLRQILRKPEYGKYVRSLKWTVGLEHETLGFRQEMLRGERRAWRTGDTEKMFECLDQVVSLDIESATRDGGMIFKGKNLFPAAQRVNLRGTSYESSILYGTSKAPLSTLHLGPYRITRPDPSRLTGTANEPSFGSSSQNQPPQNSKYPNLLHPSFHNRCKNLHTFSLTIQLSDNRSEVEDFYISLAAFLPNICPRTFIFTLVGMNGRAIPQPFFRHRGDKRVTGKRKLRGGIRRDVQWSCVSSIAQANIVPVQFRDILLPVLTQGWEGLLRLEIRGVMWSCLGNMGRELRERGVELAGDGWEHELDDGEDEDEDGVKGSS